MRKVRPKTNRSKEFTYISIGLPHPLPSFPTIRVTRYHKNQGDKVERGEFIASCVKQIEDYENEAQESVDLHSTHDGWLEKKLVPEGSTASVDQPLVEIRHCLHNVLCSGLCAVCGSRVVKEDGKQHATVNIEGGERLHVSLPAATLVRNETVERLFKNKKLSLVLDLDHTLLHCTDDVNAITLAQSAPPGFLHTFTLDGKMLVLKLRAGLSQFLTSMKDGYFECYVYTAGTRAYAEKVCSIIDPRETIFGKRIISRDDTPDIGTEKSLTRLFPVDDTMVVVVDDRDVWSGVANLLTCEPFIHFHGYHDVNNPSWHAQTEDLDTSTGPNASKGASSSQEARINERMDPGLERVQSILRQIHRNFYLPKEHQVTLEDQLEGRGSDVKIIMQKIKLDLMKKFVIAFDPELSPYQLSMLVAKAVACGATCSEQVNRNITHFISHQETELAQFAKSQGVWVVKPQWLEKSEHYWQPLKEEPFAVFETFGSIPKSQQQPLKSELDAGSRDMAHVKAARMSKSEDEEDAEFAKDLELDFNSD